MSRGLRRFAVLAYLVLVLAAAGLLFLVTDRAFGRGLAVLALVGFFGAPFGVGVVVENLAAKVGRELHAEKVAAALAPLWSVLLGVLLWPFVWSPRSISFGELSPRSLPTSLPPSAPSTPSAIPSGTSTPTSIRFSSGDLSYTEPLEGCEPLASVEALESAYAPGGTRATSEALAKTRYPTGLPFLQAQDDKQLKTWFLAAPDSFDGVASRFDAAVHEGAHLWGVRKFNGRTQTYPVRSDLSVEAKLLKTFFWSEIRAHHVDPKADTYARIYLEGPSGAQGFNTLLDEYNAYAHSLASRWCTRDLLPPGSRVSARDGILTMMYYLESYLAIARTEHPKDYAAILADPGLRRVVLTVWDRAEFFLRKSADVAALGIKSDTIEGWVYEPDRLAELTRVRAVK